MLILLYRNSVFAFTDKKPDIGCDHIYSKSTKRLENISIFYQQINEQFFFTNALVTITVNSCCEEGGYLKVKSEKEKEIFLGYIYVKCWMLT